MKRKLLCLIPLFVCAAAHAQVSYGLYQPCQLQNAMGQAISGASVYFLNQPADESGFTNQAQVYSSGTGGPVSQPLTTNGFGQCVNSVGTGAYLNPGVYTVCFVSQYLGPSPLCYVDQNVTVGGAGPTSTTSLTVTGPLTSPIPNYIYTLDGVNNTTYNNTVSAAMVAAATAYATYLNSVSPTATAPAVVVDLRGYSPTAAHTWGTIDNAVGCSGSSPNVVCSYSAPCISSATVTCYSVPMTIYGSGYQDQTVDTIWMESDLRMDIPGQAIITSVSTTDPVFNTRPCKTGTAPTCTGGSSNPGNQIVHLDLKGGTWVAGNGNLQQQAMVIDCGGDQAAATGVSPDNTAPSGAGVWYSSFTDMTFKGFMAGSGTPQNGVTNPGVIQDTCNSSGGANQQYQHFTNIQVFSSDQGAVATASQSGTVMTVTSVNTGTIQPGYVVQALGSWATETVSSFGTGSGGVGTYNMSVSQNVSSGSVTIAAQSGPNKIYIGGLVESSYWYGGNYDGQGGDGGDQLAQAYGVGRYVGTFAGIPGLTGPSGGLASNPNSLTFADTAVQSSALIEEWNGTARVVDRSTHVESSGGGVTNFALFGLGVSGNVSDIIDSASIAPYIATAVASCTATQATTVLTVSACSTGTISVGQWVWGTGWTPEEVLSFGTGTGGAGTYNVSNSQTVSSGTAATISSYIFNFAKAGNGLKLSIRNSSWGEGSAPATSVIGISANQDVVSVNNVTNTGSSANLPVTFGMTQSVAAAATIATKRQHQMCLTSSATAVTTIESDLLPGEEVTLSNCSTSGTVIFQAGGNLALRCFNSGGLSLAAGSSGQAGQSATFSINDATAAQELTLTRTNAGTCGGQSFNGGGPLTSQVGTGTKLLSATGSFTSGDLLSVDPSTGSAADAGVSASGLSSTLCRLLGPALTNTGSTSQTQVWTGSCSIPANTVDATGTLNLDASGSVCTGSGAPYSGCTAVNTGTCGFAVFLGATNTAKTAQLANLTTGADKAWTLHSTVQSQNSTSSQIANAWMIQGTATVTGGQSAGTISQTATMYLNVFVTNSVSGDVCGIDQIRLAYTP